MNFKSQRDPIDIAEDALIKCIAYASSQMLSEDKAKAYNIPLSYNEKFEDIIRDADNLFELKNHIELNEWIERVKWFSFATLYKH